jgi:hypothetical protein
MAKIEVAGKENDLREKKNAWVVGYPVSWAPCCETWLKEESEI